MQNLQSRLDPGILVRARGELWYVRRSRPAGRAALVVLEGAETTNARRTTTLLTPFDRIEPVRPGPPIRRKRGVVVAQVLDAACALRPADGLWTLPSAHLELLPWQLTPALAVVHGATRVLLADAVGLGKTVQAGLIVSELRARGAADRALILTPAALRENWATELRTRFELPVAVLDAAALGDLARRHRRGANPWTRAPIVISSIDLVKRPDVRLAVESAPFDVLVVDEAHHATPGTDRLAVVNGLAAQVPWVVLATATPHSGDPVAFRQLLDIGDNGDGSPMRVFRRSHRDAAVDARRRTHRVAVIPHESEVRLHEGVLAYARALCASPAAAPGTVLLASLLARRAASSPAAVAATLQRRRRWLGHAAPENAPAAPALPWEELDADEEEGADRAAEAAGLTVAVEELARVSALLQLAEEAAPHWTKLRRLRRLIDAVDEPLVVFTEYAATLEACIAGLAGAATVTSLHGGLSLRERHHRLHAFLHGHARILVTTDVAGEGLNLQHRARLVVTIEWPWSPLRLEQRVGRVHRLGQTRTVHAFHLTAAGSYEETVVARLLSRSTKASQGLASHEGSTARQIEAEVLGSGSPPFVQPAAAALDEAWDRAAATEARRVAALRQRRHPMARAATSTGPAWMAPRRCGAADRVAVIVEVSHRFSTGVPGGSTLIALSVTLWRRPRHRGEWRRLCHDLASDPATLERAVAEARTSFGTPEDRWASVRRRLAHIGRRRGRSGERPVQTSLFDRRAILAGERQEAVRARWHRWQEELVARLQPAQVLERARVVAVLPFHGRSR